MSKVQEISDANFDTEVLKMNGKVLVDFWAPWCGPCRMQTPILEKISATVSAKIVKLNTDDNPQTAHKYGISSIPTLILFDNGNEVDRMVGVQPEKSLIEKLK